MKTNMLRIVLLLLVTVAFSRCNKDKTNEPPVNNDPEKLAPEANKVLHYTFNGSLKDGSGNSLDGADSMNITYAADRFGRANQAAVFGGASNPSFILTPSLGARITGFPMAVSFWFKTASAFYQVLFKSDGFERPFPSGFRFTMGARPGQMGFTFSDKTSNGNNYVVTPQNVFSLNTWYHVVVNVRGANDFDFYVNGVKLTNCTYGGSATSIAFYSEPVRGIMGNEDGFSYFFQGSLDDYRVYNRVLSQQEVQSLNSFHP